MRKIILGLVTVLVICPSAFSQVTAVGSNTQKSSQTAASIGNGNYIKQDNLQVGIGRVGATSVGSGSVSSVGSIQQEVEQIGVSVGNGNYLIQGNSQSQLQEVISNFNPFPNH